MAKINVEKQLERLRKGIARKQTKPYRPGGRKKQKAFTPAEILFEIQLQSRGFIEIDVALRTTDPFAFQRHIIGPPTTIRGLEPGEIMKLRVDLQAFLIRWRTQLALERRDKQIETRMVIDGTV